MLTLSWWGQMGKGHFIQKSQDLLNWNYWPMVVTGEDAVASISLQSGVPRLFLRLEIEDDSFNTDSDGDGIPDGWEVLHGLHPHNPEDAFGMAPGGITYLRKYQLGLNPSVANTDGDSVVDGEDMFANDSRRTDRSAIGQAAR